MKGVRPHSFLLMLCAVSFLAQAAGMTLEVITLQHRNVHDVISILQPLVAPGGTVTGMHNQLIIKSTPDNLAELKRVLAGIDRKPRRLLISVRQDSTGISEGREQAVSGRYSGGVGAAKVMDPSPSREGVSVSAHDAAGNVIRYRLQDSTATSNDQGTYQVQATEGHPAFIHGGQILPVPARTTRVTPQGVVVTDGTAYVDATSGFYVLPRVNGDLVTLLIAPSLSEASTGAMPVFDVQHVETTATGRLGEWLQVAGINQAGSGSDRRLLSTSSHSGQISNTFFIKVDELD